MNTMQQQTRRFGHQQGQGMTEYIIIVALIAIAAIAVFTFFGGTAREQVGGMAKELAGQSASESIANAGKQAEEAKKEGGQTRKKGLDDYKNK